MIDRLLTKFSLGSLILLLTAAVALAQATAQLTGTVRDESGAVLPGVTVTATQTDTGFSRTVVTDGEGAYVLTNLPTGPYRLEVSLTGLVRNIAVGPNFWNIDLSISRLIELGPQRLELRVESFNLLNHFNWGNPQTNFNSGQFGRITSQTGAPRIMQLGVKYAF